MDEKTLAKALSDHQKELRQLIDRRLPVIIGRMAKDHFQNNFRQGGFVNGGFTPWPTTQRQKRVQRICSVMCRFRHLPTHAIIEKA